MKGSKKPLDAVREARSLEGKVPPALKIDPAVAFFAISLGLSSFLLFWIQPLFSKMILPMLGGAPAVWNTAMVFFQATLLAGYFYAHRLSRLPALGSQIGLHALVLAIGLFFLPIAGARGWSPPQSEFPAAWMLLFMVASIGAPFFALSATAPLVQHWFSRSGRIGSANPYFLYAASNIGSLASLAAFPILFEPLTTLRGQAWAWGGLYVLAGMAVIGCGILAFRARVDMLSDYTAVPSDSPSFGLRLSWSALAFLPSSLLLGVTTHISTDVAAVPLLWIVPLSLYLLSFVIVFAPGRQRGVSNAIRSYPILLISLFLWMTSRLRPHDYPLAPIALHLAAFFTAALVCHGRLAASRPPAQHLTTFYLWLSLGGVAGGIFNALVAPLVFSTVLEYPLILALSALALPVAASKLPSWEERGWDLLMAFYAGALMVGLDRGLGYATMESGNLRTALVLGFAGLLCYAFRNRPPRLALALGMVAVTGHLYLWPGQNVILAARSFFGVYRVTEEINIGPVHTLKHGSTTHGLQWFAPGMETMPLTYFHPTGPVGEIFADLALRDTGFSVAIVGLGAGSLASYATAERSMTFYEIDPLVERIARDGRYFTLLEKSAGRIDVRIGDARLRLAEASDGEYGMILIDAFSSDAIPVHLVTRESLRLYLRKLAPRGILTLHISNGYMDLLPVMRNLAADAGLSGLYQDDFLHGNFERYPGKCDSIWVVLAQEPDILNGLRSQPHWHPLPGKGLARPWTDDFSNILTVLRWR